MTDPLANPPSSPATSAGTAGSPLPDPAQGVILAPRPWVPFGVVLLGVASLALNLWAALVVGLFGLFLLVQSQILRLELGPEALVVWRQQQELRRFPYHDWLNWTVFWPRLPVLFYFREQQSIHLLPMLFDAETLRDQLRQRLPLLSPAPEPSDG
jgi:hypothetical protein